MLVGISDGNPVLSSASAQPVPQPATGEFSPPEHSEWLRHRSNAAAKLIELADADLLILPVQGPSPTLAPSERSILGLMVADRVMRSADISVASPVAVWRYVGGHRRSIPLKEIAYLARISRAERVVGLYARYRRGGTFDFRAEVLDPATGEVLEERSWKGFTASDTALPHEQVASKLDEIASFAAGTRVRTKPQRMSAKLADLRIPEDLDELRVDAESAPLLAAAYLQFLGDLYPRDGSRDAKFNLYERSLVLLQRLDDRTSYKRLLAANALATLGRRPAALALLQEPQNEHEQALLQYLNGNLPELQSAVEKPSGTIPDFIVLRDRQTLASAYGQEEPDEEFEALATTIPAWSAFFERQIRGYDDWAVYSAAPMKENLERLFPTNGVSLDSDFLRRSVIGDFPDEADLSRLVLDHIAEASQTDRLGMWLGPGTEDLLDLAREVLAINQYRRAWVDFGQRDIPGAALDEINAGKLLFSGHPALTVLEGRVLEAMSRNTQGSESASLRRAASDSLLRGYAWSTYLNPTAARVALEFAERHRSSSFSNVNPGDQDVVAYRSSRTDDWPRGPDWYARLTIFQVRQGELVSCTRYLVDSFWCMEAQVDHWRKTSTADAEEIRKFIAGYEHRYNGSQQKARFEVASAVRDADGDGVIEALRAQIDSGTDDWALYHALASELVKAGNYSDAQSVWLSYPEFNEWRAGSTVRLSQHADIAAARLYWIGQHELARPLLEMSAGSGTGSGGAMSSSERLALIDRDLPVAAQWAAERVRRYDSKYGLRDLIQIAHLLGEHEVAWQMFDQSLAREPNTHIWSGALIGHRMASTSFADIVEWAAAVSERNSAYGQGRNGFPVQLGPRYFLVAGTMDRKPDASLVEALSEYDFAPAVTIRSVSERSEDYPATVVAESNYGEILADRKLTVRQRENTFSVGERVPRRFEMIGSAMTSFLDDEFEQAFWKFNEIAHIYTLHEYLPHFAFAAGKTGNLGDIPNVLAEEAESLLQQENQKPLGERRLGTRFDHVLAMSVSAAFAGDHTESLSLLREAIDDRPFMEYRSAYPMFLAVDFADRLFRETGHDGYRALALDVSRRHTVVLPMYAWAYFVVAAHAESRAERIEAAASGLALDPESTRKRYVTKDILTEAQKRLERAGAPFLVPRSSPAIEGA